ENAAAPLRFISAGTFPLARRPRVGNPWLSGPTVLARASGRRTSTAESRMLHEKIDPGGVARPATAGTARARPGVGLLRLLAAAPLDRRFRRQLLLAQPAAAGPVRPVVSVLADGSSLPGAGA